MSKKKHRQFNSSGSSLPAASTDLAAEYRIIKWDLVRVVVMNLVFLGAVLTLYYTNLHSGYLERWFEKLLHF